MNTFEQHTHGTTTLTVDPATHHCGIADKSNRICITYTVSMQFTEGALDENGFLLNNLWFKGYFAQMSLTPVTLSCEELCQKVCNDICSELGERAHYLLNLECQIEPFEGTGVEWDEKPHLSRKAKGAEEQHKAYHRVDKKGNHHHHTPESSPVKELLLTRQQPTGEGWEPEGYI